MTASSRDLLSLRTAAELAAIALLVLLTGCASQPPSPIDGMDAETAAAKSASRKEVAIPVATETVREGDTLYAIAFRRGLDFLDIAAWNGIKPPYTIFPGQRLRLGPANETATAAAATATRTRPAVAAAEAPGAETAATTGAATTGAAAGTKANDGVPTPAQRFVPLTSSLEAGSADQVSPVETTKPAPAQPQPAQSQQPPQLSAVAPPPASAPGAAGASVKAGTKPVPPLSEPPVAGADAKSWLWPTSGKLVAPFGVEGRKGVVIGGSEGQAVKAARAGEVVYAGGGLLGYGQLVIVKHDETYLSAYGNNSRLLVKEGARVKAGDAIAEMGSSGDGRTGLHFELRKHGRPVDPLSLVKPPL